MSGWLVAKRSARLSSSAKAGFGHDADAREQRQRLVEDAALGDGDDDRFGHGARGFTWGCGSAQQGADDRLRGATDMSATIDDGGEFLRQAAICRRDELALFRLGARGGDQAARARAANRADSWPTGPGIAARPRWRCGFNGGIHAWRGRGRRRAWSGSLPIWAAISTR